MLHLCNSDNLKTTTDTNLHSFCAKCQQYLIVDLQLICNLCLSSTSIKGMSKNNRKSIFFNVSGLFLQVNICLSVLSSCRCVCAVMNRNCKMRNSYLQSNLQPASLYTDVYSRALHIIVLTQHQKKKKNNAYVDISMQHTWFKQA